MDPPGQRPTNGYSKPEPERACRNRNFRCENSIRMTLIRRSKFAEPGFGRTSSTGQLETSVKRRCRVPLGKDDVTPSRANSRVHRTRSRDKQLHTRVA